VVAAARLLDRGRALHRAIARGRREAAFAADWMTVSADIDDQRARWRQSLGAQADWRDWHDSQAAARDGLWSQERDRRLAYVASLRGVAPSPAPPRAGAEPKAAVLAEAVAAAAPATGEIGRRVASAEPRRDKPKSARPAHLRARNAAAKARHPGSHRRAQEYGPEQPAPQPPDRQAQHHVPERPAPEPAHRSRNVFRDVGRFFKRTFGARIHHGNEAPDE
jgi:hypothetical protein